MNFESGRGAGLPNINRAGSSTKWRPHLAIWTCSTLCGEPCLAWHIILTACAEGWLSYRSKFNSPILSISAFHEHSILSYYEAPFSPSKLRPLNRDFWDRHNVASLLEYLIRLKSQLSNAKDASETANAITTPVRVSMHLSVSAPWRKSRVIKSKPIGCSHFKIFQPRTYSSTSRQGLK